MENSKLISLLKTFSKNEMKEFEKFILSPFHIKGRDLKSLFDFIKKYYPEFDNPKFTKEKIYASLFPQEKYDDGKMRKLLSYLYKAGEDFLMQVAIEKNKHVGQLLLLKELKERKMDSSFRILSEKLSKEIKMENFTSREYFLYKYQLYSILTTFYYDINDFQNSIKTMEKEFDSATGFYLYVAQITRHLYISVRMHFKDINFEILEALDKNFDYEGFFNSSAGQKEEVQAVLPFYYLNKSFLQTDDTATYNTAKNLVLQNLETWSQNDRFTSLGMLMGIVSLQSNSNKQGTGKEAFEITSLMIKHNAYKAIDEKYLSLSSFRNVIAVSLDVCEYDWLENFVKYHIKELAPEYRENMKYYTLAKLEYARNNFESAMSYINRVKYEIFILKIDAVKLNMILLYTLKEYQAARDFIDSTRKYFSGSKDLTDFYKISSENFLKYYKLLLKYADKPDKISAEMNYKKLSGEEVIADKGWLIKQFEKLI